MPYAAVGDLNIYYEWHGSAEAEPLLLMSGAFGVIGPKSDWSYQLPRFAEHYHVLIYEHRGHGRTDNPANRFEGYDVLADDAGGLLTALDVPKAHVVAFSDGGITALEMARRYPELIIDMVVIGANYRNDDTVINGLVNLRAEVIEQKYPDWAKTLEEQHGMRGPGYWKTLADQLRELWLRQPDYTPEQLAEISVPTLVMTGQYDPYGNLEQTLTIFKSIANSELCIIPGAAHPVMIQRAEPVTLLILDYLARQKKRREKTTKQG